MSAHFDSDLCLLVLALGHFLWQGLLIGWLAWLAALALRRGGPAVRYRVWLAALVVMAACPVLTFVWLGRDAAPPPPAEPPLVSSSTPESPAPLPEPPETTLAVPVDSAGPVAPRPVPSPATGGEWTAGPPPVADAKEADWRRFAPGLAAAYLVGVLAMFVRLVLGLRGGRRLRRGSEPAADRKLLDLLARRAAAIGLCTAPALAWCREIAVPTVVGVLRPAILLPMSMTTGLTSEQLAAILTHELAHIRRWDPLVNVVQRFVEAALFFHPMVWLVSRRIRQERENCCDDLVLATGAGPVDYASSLLDVAERAAAGRKQGLPAVAALRADGRPSELGGRIRRLLGAEPHESMRLNRPGLVLTAATVALLALAALLAVDAAAETPTTARATLPNGVIVELVGIGFHPSRDREWWKPDGTTLETRPYETSGATVMPGSPQQADCREFRIEIRGLPPVHAVATDYGAVNAATGSTYAEGLWVGDHAAGPFPSQTTSVRVALATEALGPAQVIDARGRKPEPIEMAEELKPLYEQVAPLRVEESERGTELVFPAEQINSLRKRADWRVHAIDVDGREQRSTFSSGTWLNELHLGFPIPVAHVARFEYRLRPYRYWVTFHNVTLQPGKKTNMEIETEAADPAMSQDEQNAWRELEATGVMMHGEPFHRGHLRRQLAILERINSSESERNRIREQLKLPVRSAELWWVPPPAWPLIGRLESLHELRIVASGGGEDALRHVARLPNLRGIRMTNTTLLPTDAAALKAATPLEEMEITFTIFDEPAARRRELLGVLTDAEQAWAEVYRMRHSGREHIIEAAILTDRMLEAFRDLRDLRTLRLVNTSVSGRGVEAIGVHRALEELDVNIVDLPPDAARALGRLTRLRKFRTAEGVSDETLGTFAGLVNLEELELWAGDVTNAGTRHLVSLESLRKLALRGSAISDAGLLELAALPKLQQLDLRFAKGALTPAGLAEFQRLKPQCRLITDTDDGAVAPGDEDGAAHSPVAPQFVEMERPAHSLALREAGTARISGTVRASTGEPVPRA